GDAVRQSFLAHLDRGPLDAEVLTDERSQRPHRAAQLTAEHGRELVGLLVGSRRVDERADAPVPVRHHLGGVGDGGNREPADVRALDLAVLDREHERHLAAVVVGAERQRCGARADDFARARLEIGPTQLPGHVAILYPGAGPSQTRLRATASISTSSPGASAAPTVVRAGYGSLKYSP